MIGTIRLHDGHAGNTGSWGCLVSPDYHAFRRTLVDRYRAELDDLSTAERALVDVIAGCDRPGSVMAHQFATQPGEAVPPAAHRDLWTEFLAATLYLVRPEERPTQALITSVSHRYELSRAADTAVVLTTAGAAAPNVYLERRRIAGAVVAGTSITAAVTKQDVTASGVIAGTQARLALGPDPDHLVADTTVWVTR
jgi:hypothetical protein